ncbi:MAG: head GIN domain-containing protein [Cytophagales bacterium]|nr:head GIN domain-containing protein [Cytophagales bacterium]
MDRFTGVKTGEAIDVYLKKADKESVRVEATGESLSNIVTEVSGSYLKIHLRNNSFFRGKSTVKVYVNYVSLDRISASSASNVFSDGPIRCNSMEIHASSAADIEVSLDATDVRVHASSAADVILQGTAKSIDAEASSSGDIDAYNLTVERAEASASSAGGIKLSVTQDLRANASSGGSVRYRGNPLKTNANSSSGGSVKKSN